MKHLNIVTERPHQGPRNILFWLVIYILNRKRWYKLGHGCCKLWPDFNALAFSPLLSRKNDVGRR